MKMQVWWNSEGRGVSFTYPVNNPEQARDVLNALAMYDAYLNRRDLDHDLIGTYGGLEIWDETENDWVDWTDKKGRDIWEAPL